MAQLQCRRHRLGDYSSEVGRERFEALRRLARPLAGRRVLHLGSGPAGSAVAETLAARGPLQRDLGPRAERQMVGDAAPRLGAALYRGLLGTPVRWQERERRGPAGQRPVRAEASAAFALVVGLVEGDPRLFRRLGDAETRHPNSVEACSADLVPRPETPPIRSGQRFIDVAGN